MRLTLAMFLIFGLVLAPCAKIAIGVAAAAQAELALDVSSGDGDTDTSGPCTNPCNPLKAAQARAVGMMPPVVPAVPFSWDLPIYDIAAMVLRFEGVRDLRGPPLRVRWVTYRDVYAVTSRLLN